MILISENFDMFLHPANLKKASLIFPAGWRRLYLVRTDPARLEILIDRGQSKRVLTLDQITCKRRKRLFRWLKYDSAWDATLREVREVLKRLGFDDQTLKQLKPEGANGFEASADLPIIVSQSQLHMGILHCPGRPNEIVFFSKKGDHVNIIDGVSLAAGMVGSKAKVVKWRDSRLGAAWWTEMRESNMTDFDANATERLKSRIAALGFPANTVDFAFDNEVGGV